ncbi:VCBS repeat-containing protein [candidate division KSB1 bacterium]|nr:VCBS repeat-containing protein [candidate division KSB1 bacterium]
MRRSILWLPGLLILLAGCAKKTEITPELAKQMLLSRNLGLAYLEEEKFQEAAGEFQKLAEIAPDEPLGFANLGLTYLRLGQLAPAEKQLLAALKLAPDHPDIRLLLAKVYELNDAPEQALRTLEASLQKNPNHVRTLYQAARYYMNKEEPKTLQHAEANLNQVRSALPANVVAHLELIEVLLRNGKPAEALQHMENLRQLLPVLPEASQTIFQKGVELMQSAHAEEALAPVRMFHNAIKSSALYQAALTELQGVSGAMNGEPLRRFMRESELHPRQRTEIPEALRFTEITATSGLSLEAAAIATRSDDPQIILAHGDYDGDGDQDFFVSQWQPQAQRSRQYLFANNNGAFSELAVQAGLAHEGRDLSALFADYDNDGYLDLFITNTRAHRLYHNTGSGAFRAVSTAAKIQTDSQAAAAVFADFDLEGDLDLFLATHTANRLFRNNSDGTFVEIAEEVGLNRGPVRGRQAAFGDFDDDGDLDLFVINQSGSNQYFDNLRQSFFREIAAQVGLATEGNSGAAAVGDYNNDGYLDLFVAGLAGARHSLYRNRGDGTFERDAHADSAFESVRELAGYDAAFFDADNDGFLDLLVCGSNALARGVGLFYNNGAGRFLDAFALLPDVAEACSQVEAMDYDSDGDLDLLLAGMQSIHLLRNDGGNVNNYITVRLTGLRTGSGKNNFFGIGSKVEVKAGDLTQVRVMSEPAAHFGLGDRERADLVRVVWSNGVAQNWLNPERNQTITEDQILKGSCPWLYAWNGAGYEFVTDVLWSSALGMPLGIMGKEMGYASATSGKDYFKVPGEKLRPKDGKYLLQFTSELWEASYVDRVALFAVDHPESVEIFVDEKFTPPPYSALRVYAVADKRLPVSAHDEKGNDLLAMIARADGEYISNLIPGKYQGLTAPHDLILDLGEGAQADSIFLFLYGWIFPTDASINVNLAQASAERAVPPCLQVVDDKGEWKTVLESLGFPKGKNKMMVFDLSGKFLSKDRRIRIRTNMQIYWDHIFYATSVAASALQITDLKIASADLHYRGFSEVTRATPYSPHLPDYHTVTTAQKWRDLTGSYTRYGEVLPLLLEADSKYVIMNAGDEMTLTFAATPRAELPAGWKRDFIMYNDGWVKDGDLNTAHGQTVEPLPFQEMAAYPYSAQESYPQDEEHRVFLKQFQTRQVTTAAFKRRLFEK